RRSHPAAAAGPARAPPPAGEAQMSMSWSDDTTALSTLKRRIAEFARARDWERYHTPKNLACATAAEAGELLELFLWQDTLPEGKRAQLEAEVAGGATRLLHPGPHAGVA